jgi:diaminobutyrate-2-oxoglutarate transaminase
MQQETLPADLSVTEFENMRIRILERFHRLTSSDAVGRSREHIAAELRRAGINQEGRTIPVSLLPTILAVSELRSVAAQGLSIRVALMEMVRAFVDEHRTGQLDGPLHQHFRPYAKWWDIIAGEERRTDPIQLMRFDTIRLETGGWRFLESNTCCPGGVVHCGIVRGAWRNSPLGRDVLAGESPVDYPVDDPRSFVRHLVRVAQEASGVPEPNIAICSYRGLYRNELATIQRTHEALGIGGELMLGDILDIECADDGTVSIDGRTVHLLYNKIDPLAIDPDDPEIADWIAASRSPEVEFLNSLAAMYLTEAKRSLAFLHDAATRNLLPSGPAVTDAVENHIPWTRCLPRPDDPAGTPATLADRALTDLWLDRHRYVLKPDALTRGEGVHIGLERTPDEWLMAMIQTINDGGVAQELAEIPTRYGLPPHGRPAAERQYWGVDLMYFGPEFAGPVSRAHTGMIINVGAGGSESPTIVLRHDER